MKETKDKTLEEINLVFSPIAAASIVRIQALERSDGEKEYVINRMTEKVV